eukprot:Gregarina_sp_Pseudo_9__712@NODE_1453_length_1586_cov_85_890110_g1350_i0_p1_GENE_NODE_1453_length_1586_cov_85_890110_g1350_i0NODE_1453_length_1586_cov_85_890110_g1350_i0_p1_ORF_typecomplete_len466_score146_32Amidohydro_1/PF01979_20/2_9e23Amidohydro_3/PF07969_11/9_9Amidohydro_3/PF07969_11/4_1e07_NODE_1453_length_1586_cov_85_890110_g1350_i0971494
MTAEEVTLFHNCRVLRGEELVRDEVWVRGSKVIAPEEGRKTPHKSINCGNKIIAPGFIDIQLNGAFGVDFSATKDIKKALAQCSHFLPRTGVVGYCPTVITSAPETYHSRVPDLKFHQGDAKFGASVLGAHLEGPFISRVKRGCHPPPLIQELTEIAQLEKTYGSDLSSVSIVTLAPEYSGAMEAIKHLSETHGVVVSMGHSEANFATGEEGLKHGASALTHLFSAMNAFGHREPSLPGLICSRLSTPFKPSKLLRAILAERGETAVPAAPHIALTQPMGDGSPVSNKQCASPTSVRSDMSAYCPSRLYYGLIADCGVHVHPCTLRIAYKLNRRGLCLITDAISALGLPDGSYNIGETKIEVFGCPRRAYSTGTEILAGVVASMDECVRFFHKVTGCSLAYALTAASLHPAEMLGINAIKGHLNPGADADFILTDEQITIYQTWIKGQLTYDHLLTPPEEMHVEA